MTYTERLDDVIKRACLVEASGDKAEEFIGDLTQSEADFEKLWKRLERYLENMRNNDYEEWNRGYCKENVYRKWNSSYNNYYRPYYQNWNRYNNRGSNYNKFKTEQTCGICKEDHKIW